MQFLLVCFNVLLLSQCVEGKFDPKFRMEKINFVWTKASIHVKDQTVLSKLQKDLANFDMLYLTIKQDGEHHKKAKNFSEIDGKLEKLLKRYDLDETIHAFKMKYKNDDKKVNAYKEEEVKSENIKFADERIIQLWESTNNDQGFSTDDLEEIRRQLIQLDNRCNDYNALLKHHKQLSDNHIHPQDEFEDLSSRVKGLNQEIEDSFEQLRKRVSEMKENPFKNSKVRNLWDKARRSKRLIPNELDVIKTELRHLDRHWDKIEYHSEHLSEHEDHLKSMGQDGSDDDSRFLREYQEKLQKKLKKLEAYLEGKLTSHSEL